MKASSLFLLLFAAICVELSPAAAQQAPSGERPYTFNDSQDLISSTQRKGDTWFFRVNTKSPDAAVDPINTLIFFSADGTVVEAEKTGPGEFKVDGLPPGTYELQTEDLGGQKLPRKKAPQLSDEQLAQEILKHRGLTLATPVPSPAP